MNCQPGDVARVIPPGLIARCPMCGTPTEAVRPDVFVRCTELSSLLSTQDDPWWRIEEPFRIRVEFGCGLVINTMCMSLPDAILRPIGKPSEDAVDEILQLRGAPTYDADPALLGREAAEPSGVRHG